MGSVMSPPSMYGQTKPGEARSAVGADNDGSFNKSKSGQQVMEQQMLFGMTEEALRRTSVDQLLDAKEYNSEMEILRQKSQSFPNTPKVSTVNPPQAPTMPGGKNCTIT